MNWWLFFLPIIVVVFGGVLYFLRMLYKFGSRDIMWGREIKKFRKEDKLIDLKDVIVFTGSSSIRRWDTLEDDMRPLRVINRGFGGGRIFEVTHYIDDILTPHNPKGVVFYAGENDLSDFLWVKAPSTPEIAYQDFIEFYQEVRKRYPELPVFFISIKPPKSRINKWEEMQKANMLIHEFSENNDNLFYIDVVPPMTDEQGMILEGISDKDGIHLNEKGYKIWTKTIKPLLFEYFKN